MFAILPNESGAFAERYPTFNAAQCVRNGVPRAVALEAITINPARMLGLEEHLGSIETGKIANLVVLSGDPLDFNSWVEKSFIDGILAYDRARDTRLQRLMDLGKAGEEPEPESPQEPANGNGEDNGNDEAEESASGSGDSGNGEGR